MVITENIYFVRQKKKGLWNFKEIGWESWNRMKIICFSMDNLFIFKILCEEEIHFLRAIF